MSTTTENTAPAPTPAPVVVLAKTVITSWKAPIAFLVFTLVMFALAIFGARSGDTTFRLSSPADAIQLPEVVVPSAVTVWIVAVLLAVVTIVSAAMVRAQRRVPLWLIVIFAVLFMFGFLTWAAAGSSLPMIGLLFGSLSLAVPAHLRLARRRHRRACRRRQHRDREPAARRCLHRRRRGVRHRQLWLGVIAAMIAGVLVAMVLAVFAITYMVDQVIVGVVLNVLVVGLTSFFYSQVLVPNAAVLNAPPRFERLPIPLLSDIPIIGPVLFKQTIIVYIMYMAVAAVYVGLFHTKWGLRLRAVGEHPQAADTVGIKVNKTRFWNVALAGAIAGLGGTFFTIGTGIAFNKEMTAGAGYIALAAVIFGQWDPIKATLAALLFGFASNLQNTLSVIGSPVPSEFMLMLPYVVTIFAVAGLVGKVRPPAASGKPYVKS